MKTPELSIVVPVYNVEKYLEQCIDSLLSQEFMEYEIILVDDGSLDKSPVICDNYANKNSKITVAHQQNRGVSAARNQGIRMARGKYIAFVDADDFISPQIYRRLIETLENNKADIACCNMDYYSEDGQKIKCSRTFLPGCMSGKEFTAHVFDQPKTVTGRIYNKVYLKEKIIDFFDENLHICEDLLFVLMYCVNCKKAVYIDEAYYHIRERDDSLSRSGRVNAEKGQEVRKRIISLMGTVDPELRDLAESDFLDSCLLYMHHSDAQFKRYMKENTRKVLLNSKITFKLKVVYLLKTYVK